MDDSFECEDTYANNKIDACPFEVFEDRVVLLPKSQSKTAGGLLLPEGAEIDTYYLVIGLGPAVIEGTLRLGDHVLPPMGRVGQTTLDGKNYVICFQEDIPGRVL